jgi:outer membrane protein assembly factor BamB
MKRSLVLSLLLLCLLVPLSTGTDEDRSSWEVDLDNGYISTKPIIVDEQVIVRTSGFWTGDDRPHVYAFDIDTGHENWRFRNNDSTNHDMSPLLHIRAGDGACGIWDEMVLVGWTDGRVTALDIASGSLIWEVQTEVVSWGITGEMAFDEDSVIVPTRQGISKLCLSDGAESLRVNLPELGWRNGVTVTEENYLIGNEEGVLNIISKQGVVSNISIGEGKIRHAPIVTDSGIIIHLQTNSGSQIYLDQQLLSNEGYSPAIPLAVGQDVYLATSSNIIWLDCSSNCSVEGKSTYHTNGEITHNAFNDTIWYPHNTPDGGWGTGIPGADIASFNTQHDTYTTAGVAFGDNGEMAFGNDNGILMVLLSQNSSLVVEESEDDSTDSNSYLQQSLILLLCGAMFFFQLKKNNKMATKIGLLLLLVIMIMILPDVSNIWSKEIDSLEESPGDWDESWPEEWKETQVIVFELPDGEIALGGFAGYQNVESFTDAAASDLNITVSKESYDFGVWITSFNGESGEGWEFTIDGKRSSVGISVADVDEDSVVRWSPA